MEEEKVLEPIIFTHEEFGTVRTLGDWDNPEFCLADLCKSLDLRVDGVVARLSKNPITTGVLSKHPIPDALGRIQNTYFVNEDGLYDVILDSRKPAAKKFHKWIIYEVLPTMRKTDTSDAEEPMKPLLFTHEEFGTVRTLGDWDNPEFCLADLCRSLELPQVAKVVQRLDKEVLTTHPLQTAGGIQQMYFVNEDGLYDVILDSRKPSAKKFRKWITSEVLPALRKTGSYSIPGHDDAKNIIFNFGSDNMSAASLKKGCGEELGRLSRMLGHMDALNPAQLYLMNEATLCITGHYIPTLEKFTFANYYGDEKKE